jgi:hypothetical protein
VRNQSEDIELQRRPLRVAARGLLYGRYSRSSK